ncbi:MAG TPA: hypothetical protein VH479_13230 [Acidimicrobiales bacterium]
MTEPVRVGPHVYIAGRVAWAAQLINQFATACALVGGFAAATILVLLAQVDPGFGTGWPVGAIVLALALAVPPLRVLWHGRRIRAAYGNPGRLLALVDDIPGALEHFQSELAQVKIPRERRRLQRVLAAWRSLLALRRAMNAPILDRLGELTEPLRPQSLALTTAALWASLVVVVVGLPVAVLARLAVVLL